MFIFYAEHQPTRKTDENSRFDELALWRAVKEDQYFDETIGRFKIFVNLTKYLMK